MTATAILAKTCPKCGNKKPADGFYKDNKRPDGLRSTCISCQASAGVAYREANSEKIKARSAAYHANNQEQIKKSHAKWYKANLAHKKARDAAYREANKQRDKPRIAAYRLANAEKSRAKTAEWRKNNPEQAKAANAAWRAENPGAVRANQQARRARVRNAIGKISKGLVSRLMNLQRSRCACGCGEDLNNGYHLDHVQPLAKGGSNTDDNCQLLAPICNLSKGAKCPIEWMQSRGYLL